MRTCYETYEHPVPVPATRALIEQAQGQAAFVDACGDCADFLMSSDGLAWFGYRYIDITADVQSSRTEV